MFNAMKALLVIIFLTILSQIVNAQSRVFKIEKFRNNKITETKIDTINADQIIDLNFYRKNFFKPYFIPNEFIKTNHKNEVVVKWNNQKADKDFKKNWTYTFTFDENSRVVKYEYSGCFVCSQLPYETRIKYDRNNRPIEFIESYKEIKPLELSENDPKQNIPYKIFQIEYNDNNEVIALNFYKSNTLIEKIKLLK